MKLFSLALIGLLSVPVLAGNRESGGRLAAASVYVQFGSFGTGIDGATSKFTSDLIELYQSNSLVKDVRTKKLGREGEYYVCVNFSDASSSRLFIRQLAPAIWLDFQNTRKSERTGIYVGLDCDNIKNATLQDLSAYLK